MYPTFDVGFVDMIFMEKDQTVMADSWQPVKLTFLLTPGSNHCQGERRGDRRNQSLGAPQALERGGELRF